MTKKAPATAAPGHRSLSRVWRVLLVLGIVLLAANLRVALTSVAPLVSQIRADTGISNGLAGLLTALPLLAFGVLSPIAPRLAHRFGIERVLLASMLVLAAGILLRSVGAIVVLFLGTIILGAGIAVGNVLLPGLIKREYHRSRRPHDKHVHHRDGYQRCDRGWRKLPACGPNGCWLARVFGLVGPPRVCGRRRVDSPGPGRSQRERTS